MLYYITRANIFQYNSSIAHGKIVGTGVLSLASLSREGDRRRRWKEFTSIKLTFFSADFSPPCEHIKGDTLSGTDSLWRVCRAAIGRPHSVRKKTHILAVSHNDVCLCYNTFVILSRMQSICFCVKDVRYSVF